MASVFQPTVFQHAAGAGAVFQTDEASSSTTVHADWRLRRRRRCLVAFLALGLTLLGLC